MKITISLDVDVNDLNDDAIHDLVDDWTYEMRATRRLRTGSWTCHYDTLEGKS